MMLWHKEKSEKKESKRCVLRVESVQHGNIKITQTINVNFANAVIIKSGKRMGDNHLSFSKD